MVSVKQLEGDYTSLKFNTSSDQSKSHQVFLRGIKAHLYCFGTPAKSNEFYGGFPCAAAEEQSLLDSLLLSQWEDRSWKGQLTYDVTACETKIIPGGKNLIAQLNEKWNLNFLKEFENDALQPLGFIKPSYMKTLKDNLLFCVASGENESSRLIPSALLPKEGTLVILNANPVEYGHIFLVPYNILQRAWSLDKRMLQLITGIAAEINNDTFRIFYDHNASTCSDRLYFQAGYFANPLPVELFPTISLYGSASTDGIHISEVVDYPMKALLFMSKNLGVLVQVVAEICLSLQDHNTVFNLLISDCGTKMFLFPQVHLPATGSHLSTWECSGYFVYSTIFEFDGAAEVEISKQMASASLDDKSFEALKHICCDTAIKLIHVI